MRVDRVVRELAADQRVAHALGPVQLPVRHAERVGGRDQPHGQIVLTYAGGERCLDGLDLVSHAEIALAVAEVPRDGPDRLVNLLGILSQNARGADPLDVATWVLGNESI